MIRQDYDADAGALYLKLADRKVARTVEVDSGTLADLDSAGRLVGIEVIQPDRAWPLEDVLSRFPVSGRQARELRAQYRKPPRSGWQAVGVVGVIAAAGTGAVIVGRAILKAAGRVPVR